MNPDEGYILEQCLDRLREALGSGAALSLAACPQGPAVEGACDARVRLEFDGHGHELAVEVRKRLPQEGADARARFGGSFTTVLCLPYINRNQGAALRRRNVQFVDGAGNMYIRRPGLYLNAAGHTPKEPFQGSSRTGRAFHAAGLKLLWVLLGDPRALELPNRALAKRAGIAYGGIDKLKLSLVEEGFLVTYGAGMHRLDRLPALVARWVEGYVARLRPKLNPRAFLLQESVEALVERLKALPPELRPVVGGELGASLRLPGLMLPGTASLHVPPEGRSRWRELSGALRLMSTRLVGNVVLLDALGVTPSEPRPDVATADPLLLLGELALQETDRLGELRQALLADLVHLHGGAS